jgi:hypothetical protein
MGGPVRSGRRAWDDHGDRGTKAALTLTTLESLGVKPSADRF